MTILLSSIIGALCGYLFVFILPYVVPLKTDPLGIVWIFYFLFCVAGGLVAGLIVGVVFQWRNWRIEKGGWPARFMGIVVLLFGLGAFLSSRHTSGLIAEVGIFNHEYAACVTLSNLLDKSYDFKKKNSHYPGNLAELCRSDDVLEKYSDACPKNSRREGYAYSYALTDTDHFVVAANPVTLGVTGRRFFIADQENIILEDVNRNSVIDRDDQEATFHDGKISFNRKVSAQEKKNKEIIDQQTACFDEEISKLDFSTVEGFEKSLAGTLWSATTKRFMSTLSFLPDGTYSSYQIHGHWKAVDIGSVKLTDDNSHATYLMFYRGTLLKSQIEEAGLNWEDVSQKLVSTGLAKLINPKELRVKKDWLFEESVLAHAFSVSNFQILVRILDPSTRSKGTYTGNIAEDMPVGGSMQCKPTALATFPPGTDS